MITTGTVLGVVGGALVGTATPAAAATISVTSTADDGPGSLRAALAAAGDGDTILIDLPADSTITLTSGQLLLNEALSPGVSNLTIQGPDADDLTIDANGASRAFYLYPNAPGTITVSGLTIVGGNVVDGDGGGIFARDTDLVFDDVVVEDNQASGDGGGVAVNGGSLSITDSTIFGNEAGEDGGGLDVDHFNGGFPTGSVTLVDSTVSGNTAGGFGGGASVYWVNVVTVADAVIADNHSSSAGGGLAIDHVKYSQVYDTTVSLNTTSGSGAGVAFLDSNINTGATDVGEHVIGRSTISGNTAVADGGGVLVGRSKYFELINSTVSGNTASDTGGGVQVGAGEYGGPNFGIGLDHSTIVNNSAAYGGGVSSGGPVTRNSLDVGAAAVVDPEDYSSDYYSADHTIVANNNATDFEYSNDVGGFLEVSYSLIEDTGNANGPTIIDNDNNIFEQDPQLFGLNDWGGPTFTHLPASTSPVVDAGDATREQPPDTDQRGFDRVVGPAVDIGSVERQPFDPTGAADAVVSVSATTTTAVEGGAPGAFTFTRTGPTTEALTIGYSVSGTATPDDFTPMGIVTFPPGQASVTKQVVAVADGVEEPDETVIVTLAAGSGYTTAVPVSATVTIVDEAAADEPPCGGAPEDGFTDVPDTNVHEAALDCLKFLGITVGGPQGLPDTQYGPALDVTRGQMATFLARLITEAGGTLPADPPDAFTDDDGTEHEASINALAAAGIVEGFGDGTYREGDSVRRDQMASFLLRTHDYISDVVLASGDDAFDDDEPGNVHEAAINALEEAGVIQGTATPGIYDPSGDVRRDQMASFLIRLAELLATEGNFPVAAA